MYSQKLYNIASTMINGYYVVDTKLLFCILVGLDANLSISTLQLFDLA